MMMLRRNASRNFDISNGGAVCYAIRRQSVFDDMNITVAPPIDSASRSQSVSAKGFVNITVSSITKAMINTGIAFSSNQLIAFNIVGWNMVSSISSPSPLLNKRSHLSLNFSNRMLIIFFCDKYKTAMRQMAAEQ